MPDYEIRIRIKNVAEGDVTELAQRVWDEESDDFDAARGEFDVAISQVAPGGATYCVDFDPMEAA